MYFDDIEKMQRRTPVMKQQEEKIQATSSGGPLPLPSFVASSVGSYVFETGRQKAKQALNIYSHIDYLRPYFDVEPKEVIHRLLHSLVPIESLPRLPTELYGPLMLIFTLSAILIYQMKLANHLVQDGTLIGTAFFVCFSYWIGMSFLASSSSIFANSNISLFNYLSLIGYSLFSHCIVLLIGTFIHTQYDHVIFYLLWFVLGGAAALKLATVIFSNTPHPRYRIIIPITVLSCHLLFLLYLHFAYHELAEEISHALFEKERIVPLPELNEEIKQQAENIVAIVTSTTVQEDHLLKKLARQVDTGAGVFTIGNSTSS